MKYFGYIGLLPMYLASIGFCSLILMPLEAFYPTGLVLPLIGGFILANAFWYKVATA